MYKDIYIMNFNHTGDHITFTRAELNKNYNLTNFSDDESLTLEEQEIPRPVFGGQPGPARYQPPPAPKKPARSAHYPLQPIPIKLY
jgi:hypothetical protein